MSGAAPSALYPDSLLYHEGTLWLKALAGDEALIGLTHFAQNSLGSAVHVELPAAGSVIAAGRSFGLIEADKIAYELVAPAHLGDHRRICGQPRRRRLAGAE